MSRESDNPIVQLSEMRDLEDGWNGEGTLAPLPAVFANCYALIDLWYPRATDVTPNGNGTISFDWPGSSLEVGRTRFSMYTDSYFISGKITDRDLRSSAEKSEK